MIPMLPRRTVPAVAAALLTAAVIATAPAFGAPSDPGTPSQQQVDEAKAAASAAAGSVDEIQKQYAAASARLDQLDQGVAVAEEKWNAAKLRLDAAQQAAADAAQEAQRTSAKADESAAVIRRYAAQVYQTQSGLGDIESYLSSGGPQQLADRSAVIDELSSVRRKALADASGQANAAAEAKRRADAAEQQFQQATGDATAARAAARTAADQAHAEQTRIATEQQARIAKLAQLRNTSVQIEQARQDGLARQAAAEAAARQAELERQAALKAQREQEARDAEARAAAARAAADQAAKDAAAAGNSGSSGSSSSGGSSGSASPRPSAGSRQAVVDFAYAQLGKPYVWGAEGPNAYDCSGLTMMAYRRIGIYLEHGSQWQYNNGTKIPLSQLQPGDLVFFGTSGPSNHHVGIYIGNGQMIHAPNSRTVVKISSIYYSSDLVQYGARY